MTNFFDNKAKVNVNADELLKITKKYKKLKKYMKSNIYELHSLNQTETYISNLLKEYGPEEKENESIENQ